MKYKVAINIADFQVKSTSSLFATGSAFGLLFYGLLKRIQFFTMIFGKKDY